ncbi:hypothetical protein ABZ864_47620 [Streptomyces sp. NPDC047082]|uniref:hypothetical protein n=1 Tax=Streptomyces sp. NPDC047082 TaxID=3155259 RepID=UPI003400546D
MKDRFTGLETVPAIYQDRILGIVETHGPNAHSAVTSNGGRLARSDGVAVFYPSVAAGRAALIERFERKPWRTLPAHAIRPIRHQRAHRS